MRTDDALDAILALEALWRARRGRVTLEDVGIGPGVTVRSRGFAALPPERWRNYPGATAMRQERVEES